MKVNQLWLLSILLVSIVFFAFVFYKTNSDVDDGIPVIQLPTKTFRYQGPAVRKLENFRDNVTVLLWVDPDKQHERHWTGLNSFPVFRTPNFVGHEVDKSAYLCPVPCTITTERDKLGTANAVVFEPDRDTHKSWDFLRIPVKLPQKRPGQVWVNLAFQQPEQFPILKDPNYVQLFELNMTYQQSESITNLPVSLFCNWGGGNLQNELSSPPKPKTEDKVAVFFSNNCHNGGARSRMSYVQELMKYLKVDAYGDCLHNKDYPVHMRQSYTDDKSRDELHGALVKHQIEIASQYKFMLAFESNNITDYVTHKLMVAFKAGVVPVYMGAPNVDDWIPSPKSIIRTDKFKSPADLAEELLRLSQNEREYKKFFEWKSSPLPKNFQEKLDRCLFYNTHCRLCEKVANILTKLPDTAIGNEVIRDKNFALSLDGSSAYVEIGNYPEVSLTDAFTISAWIYMNSINDYRIVDKNSAGTVDGYSLDVLSKNGRGFLRLCAADICWMGMKPVSTHTWYHVTVVFVSYAGGKRLKHPTSLWFYINGKLDYIAEFPNNIYGVKKAKANDIPLRIGRAGRGDNYWPGMIDDVSLWNIALSEEKIRTLPFERLGGNEEGLVGYWSFNEGQGDTVYDYSKSKRHGKLKGNYKWVPSEEKDLTLNSCV